MRFSPLAVYRDQKLRETQAKVARRAGIAQCSISGIERGHMPKTSTIRDIAKAYGLSEARLCAFIRAARPAQEHEYPLFAELEAHDVLAMPTRQPKAQVG